MVQPSIIILTDQHGQQVGAQLQAILQREGGYQVGCLAGLLPTVTEVVEPRPDLILPVLPAARERAEHLLVTLQVQVACPPLVPVLRAADLHQWPDGLSRWATDFLVTPLREAEVRARVRRLLLGSSAPARAILRYLEAHPEAKDTVEGIAQWWLLHEWNEPLRVHVERAVSLLLSQNLMLEIRRPGVPAYYQRHSQQREAITTFLQGS
jgi:DNA-binding response OmpR family regulator